MLKLQAAGRKEEGSEGPKGGAERQLPGILEMEKQNGNVSPRGTQRPGHKGK